MPNYYANACHDELLAASVSWRESDSDNVEIEQLVAQELQSRKLTHVAVAKFITEETPSNAFSDRLERVSQGTIILGLYQGLLTRAELTASAKRLVAFQGTADERDVPFQIERKAGGQTGWVVSCEPINSSNTVAVLLAVGSASE